MRYATVQLCSGGGGFEAVPHPRAPIDLRAARARLEASGVLVVDARVMLIVRLEREVTVSRDGRILIKTRNAAEAERIFAEVCARLALERAPADETSLAHGR
jgi:hypothetical protein